MQLYVVRHAIAAELVPGEDDADRPLTRKGIQRFRKSMKGLGALDASFASVLHSPWRRAVETAQLLAPLVVAGGPSLATPLLCTTPSTELLELIAARGRAAAAAELATDVGHGVVVVGHEPWLGELIGLLIAGDPRCGESLVLKKGSVSCLEGSAVAGGMSLRALLPPKVLRALADVSG
jgi:phosphohistidine phosphatase